MNWLTGLWLIGAGAITVLVITKQTRWYELLLLGGWGLMTGALLAGARTWNDVSIQFLWKVLFG